MNIDLILSNLLSPPILFFALGLVAVAIKSDLEIPQPLPKLFSLYLLFAIGFKGGVELKHSGFDSDVFISLGLAIAASIIVPLYTFFILKKKVNVKDAGAIAATYGSISAVTFITACNFLTEVKAEFGGHMVAAMALMESPAIIVGVMLINKYSDNDEPSSTGKLFREAVTNGSVVLILGSLIIGLLVEDKAVEALHPFTHDIFKGMLTFFLLDMGLLAGKRIGSMRKAGSFLVGFSIVIPLLNAMLAIFSAHYLGLGTGDTLLLTVLFASASYIAVPAAIRLTVPEANPGLYVPMSLAITFPFNIIVGIPLYYFIIESL